MQLGIFAKTFVRPSLEDTLDAVKEHGFDCVQFNMSCAGLPSLPEEIDTALCERIRREMAARQITMAAVSGTFNMIHPDERVRRDGLRRLRVLASACQSMGTRIITLCTGTRDPVNMWRDHPDNSSDSAWQDLLLSMRQAVFIAVEHNVTLAIEPEIGNIVRGPLTANILLDEVRSPRLKIVLDAANLIGPEELGKMHLIIMAAVAALGKDTVLAHAKDLNQNGEVGHAAAGKSRLDFHHYLDMLALVHFDGPLIMHGLTEDQVDERAAFLRETLKKIHSC